MMRRALSLARRGEGWVEPNPMVGCVIVRGERIIGEGYHRRFGGPHAEIVALRRSSSSPRGSIVYVSLEPCCHHGKTPPCVDALIEAGVSRVVAACRDPNPQVSGGGIDRLRRAGIRVDVGVFEAEALELLAPFLTRTLLGRPYVIAKWAQSLDGKLATRTGDARWISNESSRGIAHRLRARVDAILVGVNTVLRDDPLLSARGVPVRRAATRVVLDSRLRIPTECRLVGTARDLPTVVYTTIERRPSAQARRLERAGVAIVGCRTAKGRVSLRAVLKHLACDGVTNLMVEGGPTVLSGFLTAGLVDEAWVFTAPILIGSHKAPGSFDNGGVARIASAIKPRKVQHRRIGSDSFDRLWFTDPPHAAG